jgi:pimeloyl-ACP methyl ester carboxylesterase
MLIPGGGLNSSISFWTSGAPFNAMEEFKEDYRCITMDLRNANSGRSSGPVEVERPWEAYAEDQLSVMDHLGIREFMVLGFCIGGPFILKLMEMAPQRVVAGVLCQPSGFRPEQPDVFWNNNTRAWGPPLRERRPEVTTAMVEAHLHALYRVRPDFVFSVTRDFVRSCEIPMLVMPDDVAAHPFQVSMDIFKLAPNAEVSMYPWKEPKELIPAAVARARSFLKAHEPVLARR